MTILELKNKQQARLLQQVRGVRNSLMQFLQEPKEKDGGSNASPVGSRGTPQHNLEVARLKAGMKTALAHIKGLEFFIDEM